MSSVGILARVISDLSKIALVIVLPSQTQIGRSFKRCILFLLSASQDTVGSSVVQESNAENLPSFNVTPSQLFVKMRKLTLKALAALKYEMLSGSLDEFTGKPRFKFY